MIRKIILLKEKFAIDSSRAKNYFLYSVKLKTDFLRPLKISSLIESDEKVKGFAWMVCKDSVLFYFHISEKKR